MLALEIICFSFIGLLLLSMHLYFKGFKKLALALRDFLFGAGLFYALIVLLIGFGGC